MKPIEFPTYVINGSQFRDCPYRPDIAECHMNGQLATFYQRLVNPDNDWYWDFAHLAFTVNPDTNEVVSVIAFEISEKTEDPPFVMAFTKKAWRHQGLAAKTLEAGLKHISEVCSINLSKGATIGTATQGVEALEELLIKNGYVPNRTGAYFEMAFFLKRTKRMTKTLIFGDQVGTHRNQA